MRVTDNELIVYSPELRELTRHELAPAGSNLKRTKPNHAPGRDEKRRLELLAERFAELGPDGIAFLEQLVRARRYGKDEAHRLLGLLAIYAHDDLVAALARASRYRAFSLTAVERILSAQAKPKSVLDSLAFDAKPRLSDLIADEPVPPRPTAEYLSSLETDENESKDQESS